MDSSEAIAAVCGIGGLLLGSFGAWRSWRTDRSLKLLGKKWEFEATELKWELLLHNRMPEYVYGIDLIVPDGYELRERWNPECLGPNETARFLLVATIPRDREPAIVTWHSAADLSDQMKTWEAFLPAAFDVRS